MRRRETLHAASQVGAGFLLAVLMASVGLVLLLGLQERPAAWGVALLVAGASFGTGFAWVLRADRRRRETHPGSRG